MLLSADDNNPEESFKGETRSEKATHKARTQTEFELHNHRPEGGYAEIYAFATGIAEDFRITSVLQGSSQLTNCIFFEVETFSHV